MRQIAISIWMLMQVLTAPVAMSQVVLSPIPDQVIGIGGSFQPVHLSGYSTGDPVLWEVGFVANSQPVALPDWSVQGSSYQFEMSVTAVVESRGMAAAGDAHRLAVVDQSGKVRGVEQALAVGDQWVYFLTVYGNAANEQLRYQFYDASRQEILPGSYFAFNPNAVVGQPDAPEVVEAAYIELNLSNAVLDISLAARDFVGKEQVVITARSVADPEQVQRDTVVFEVIADYEPVLATIPGEIVSFGDSFTEIPLANYLTTYDADAVTFTASTGSELQVSISESHVATVTYPLGWFGTGIVTITVTDQTSQAFSARQDVAFVVRAEEQAPVLSAIADQKIGTGGTFAEIDLSDYLTTNNPEGISWSYRFPAGSQSSAPVWQVNGNSFEYNMSATCEVSSFGQPLSGKDHLLAAFRKSDNQLLGVVDAEEVNGKWYYFLTINGNTSGTEVYFRLYDASLDRILDIKEEMTFIPNEIKGDPLTPIALHAGSLSPKLQGSRLSIELLNESWVGAEELIIIATDTTTSQQLAAQDTIRLEIIDVQSPVFSDIPKQTISEGQTFTAIDLSKYLSGVAEDQVNYQISGADTLKPQLVNGEIRLTMPSVDYFGVNKLQVKAVHKDFSELTAMKEVTLEVLNVNDAPQLIGTPETSAPVGGLYRYEINSKDIDDNQLSMQISGKPEWLVFVSNGGFGILFGTPQIENVGSYPITVSLSDGKVTVLQNFTLEVINSYARLKSTTAQTIQEGAEFTALDLTTLTDKTDDYTVSYAVKGQMNLTATISGTSLSVAVPNEDWFGKETLTIQLLDAANGNAVLDETVITYEVQNVNDAPEILTETLSGLKVLEKFEQTVQVTDLEGDALSYSLTGKPVWLISVAVKEGLLLYGTPSKTDFGMVNLTLEVTDGTDQISKNYSFEVLNSYAKLNAATAQTIQEGAQFTTLDLTTLTDKTDDYTVSYTVMGQANLTATISGTSLSVAVPNEDWFGKETLTIQLLDAANSNAVLDETTITYEVQNVNDAPEILTETLSGLKVLEKFEQTVQVTDLEGDALSYSLTGKPVWLTSVAVKEGLLLYGTPSKTDFGMVNLTLEVTDGTDQISKTYSFEVLNSYAKLNAATAQTIQEGAQFTTLDLTTLTDKTDDYTVSYAVKGQANLTATITGTSLSVAVPDENWFGKETLTILLLDAANGNAVLDETAITYEVQNVNDAPEILTETLADAAQDVEYSIEIMTTDIEGDALTYTLENAPGWLTATPTLKGLLLFGVPEKTDVGTKNFTLKVTDGQAEVSKSFSIKVQKKIINTAESAQVRVYPNPASEVLIIGQAASIQKIELVTLDGRLVLEQTPTERSTEIRLDVSTLRRGIYLLRSHRPDEMEIQKIILF